MSAVELVPIANTEPYRCVCKNKLPADGPFLSLGVHNNFG